METTLPNILFVIGWFIVFMYVLTHIIMILTFGYISGLNLLTKELQNHCDNDFVSPHATKDIFLVGEFIILSNIYGFDKILLFNYYLKGFGLVPKFTKAHKLLKTADIYCKSLSQEDKEAMFKQHIDTIWHHRLSPFII
jgi:hypothetical protein